eukprot:16441832-Heterocapsa_arctica.AAC.1
MHGVRVGTQVAEALAVGAEARAGAGRSGMEPRRQGGGPMSDILKEPQPVAAVAYRSPARRRTITRTTRTTGSTARKAERRPTRKPARDAGRNSEGDRPPRRWSGWTSKQGSGTVTSSPGTGTTPR